MKSRYRPALLAFAALASVAIAPATSVGEETVAVAENFDTTGDLPDGFRVAKGEWQISDGVLTGAELEIDEHAAVLSFGEANTDSVVSLRFRFDGATFFHLSLNHARGHLFRVILDPAQGMAINKDKDKKDPASKAIVLGKQESPISPGEWHTLTVAIAGDSVTATLDDGEPLEVSHEGLAVEKTGYRLIVRGQSIAVDDIRVSR